MSGSRSITDEGDLLDNVHPGDILRHDFLIGGELPLTEVSEGTGIDPDRLSRLLDGEISVDADLDLRLGRHFDMSEGFFMRLQQSFDIEEAKRAHGDEFDRIVPRAA